MAKQKEDEMTNAQALRDFQWAYDWKSKFIQSADSDFEFALGAQWDDEDVKQLEEMGVLPLTINKIKPIIRLLKGIESQNRSEAKAFPEGAEDSIKADIATRLLKNAMKMDEGTYKLSEMFGDGNTCGESWIEPYLDYSRSLIEADLGMRKSDYWTFVWDPNSREYDLRDAQFVSKITFDLSKDQILSIYPNAEDVLDAAKSGKIALTPNAIRPDQLGADRQVIDYGKQSNSMDVTRQDISLYDLLEHYYKKYVTKYYVVDSVLGKIVEAASKEDAQAHLDAFNPPESENEPAPDAEDATDQANGAPKKTAEIINRRVPEIWCRAMVGGSEDAISDERAWSYPAWKSWPFMPYFCERTTSHLRQSKRDLAVQGVTRDLRPLNQELNKRRTQELRHLNQSSNSGWLTPENAWVDREEVEQLGSAPGVNLEYKPEIGKPERIFPTPISQGHAQMAEEHAKDMESASGINADLLAMQEGGSDSGRAIAIRQKQGLVMVQGFFDNFSRTKKVLAKFILSQLPLIYTVERAMRVCGEAFLKENFTVPVMGPPIDQRTGQPGIDPKTGQPPVRPDNGQPIMVPQIDPMTGQPQTQVDMQAAQQVFGQVLSDSELAMYDVAVGETISQDTVQYANYLQLSDMAKSGVPIPPDVLVDESGLPTAQKAKIKSAMQQEAAMAAQAAGAKTPPKKASA